MKMKWLVLALAAWIGLMPVSHAREMSATYRYFLPENGTLNDNEKFIFDADGTVGEGDQLLHVLHCSPKSPYHCVVPKEFGYPLEFAVPRRELRISAAWKFHGRDYQVVTNGKPVVPEVPFPDSVYYTWHAAFLGSSEPYILIRSGNKDGFHNLYFYSYLKGLIGFVRNYRDEKGALSYGPIYWLEDADGVCSDAFEKNVAREALVDGESQIHFKSPTRPEYKKPVR